MEDLATKFLATWQSLMETQAFVLILVFAAVVLITGGLMELFASRSNMQRRLAGEAAGGLLTDLEAGGSILLRDRKRAGFWASLLAPVARRFKTDDDALPSGTRLTLIQAGYMNRSAVGIYYASRAVGAIALPALVSVVGPFLTLKFSVNSVLLMAVVAGFIGLYAPYLVVARRVAHRQRAAREGFPDALDLLLVSVEAGLGLDAAINRVAPEVAHTHPVIGEELGLVGLELRAGKTRDDAIRNLAMRIGITEIDTFVALMLQTEKLGTSISEALRVQATDMRARRLLKAEEKAARLPVLLAIPLIFCILPSLMIVIGAPPVIRVLHDLLPTISVPKLPRG